MRCLQGQMIKKLEDFYPDLLPNTYLIHSEGGWHPWKNVSEAAPIYHEKIWPYIERIHWPGVKDRAAEWRKNNRAEQLNPCMDFFHFYPYCTLQKTKRTIVLAKGKMPYNGFTSFGVKMHMAVGRAFIPNPEEKPQICHLNDDISNYLISNLEWGTNRENHTGRDADSKMSNSVLHTIFRMRGWAKG